MCIVVGLRYDQDVETRTSRVKTLANKVFNANKNSISQEMPRRANGTHISLPRLLQPRIFRRNTPQRRIWRVMILPVRLAPMASISSVPVSTPIWRRRGRPIIAGIRPSTTRRRIVPSSRRYQ